MATPPPKKPKGILKPASAPGTLAADQAAAARAREIATAHARIIHHRRDMEDEITDSLVELARYPLERGDGLSAASPAPSDAAAFRRGVRLFQPSDYDDLIEERNANGLCGYTLCAEPRMRVRGGEWKIMGSHILPKKEVERWCSTACARRAMYVKVQLNETAAWERAGIESIEIDLYEEPEKNKTAGDDPQTRLAKDLSTLQVEQQRKAAKDAQELALERGDTGDRKNQRSIPVRIREHKVVSAAEEPSLQNDDDDAHMLLDGYKTKFESQPQQTTQDAGVDAAS